MRLQRNFYEINTDSTNIYVYICLCVCVCVFLFLSIYNYPLSINSKVKRQRFTDLNLHVFVISYQALPWVKSWFILPKITNTEVSWKLPHRVHSWQRGTECEYHLQFRSQCLYCNLLLNCLSESCWKKQRRIKVSIKAQTRGYLLRSSQADWSRCYLYTEKVSEAEICHHRFSLQNSGREDLDGMFSNLEMNFYPNIASVLLRCCSLVARHLMFLLSGILFSF